MKTRAAGLALLSFALAAPARGAGVVGSGTPGSCTETALNTALSGGGMVTFSCGPAPVTILLTTTKTISVATTVDGGGLVALDGGNTVRIFTGTFQVPLTVRNITLRNGRATDYGAAIGGGWQSALTVTNVVFEGNVCTQAGADVGGGAIFSGGASLNVSRSTFTGNRGGNGGAILSRGAGLTVDDCSFDGNLTNAHVSGAGGAGGAIFIDGSGSGVVLVRRSTFTSNVAMDLGGAVHVYLYAGAQTATFEDTVFRTNSGVSNGGAIFHMNGGLTISGSTFTGNTVLGQGGAIWVGPGSTPATVTNSTFTGNDAIGIQPNAGSTGLGGAILKNGGTLALSHVTISGNHANWVGGGICGGSAGDSMHATLVANNTADNGGNPWNIGKSCTVTWTDGGGNFQIPDWNHLDANDHPCTAAVTVANPLLQPLLHQGGETPTMALGAASPARGAAPGPCPATDQRGVPRPAGPCDAGAWQSGPAARYHTLTPCRLADTRAAQNPATPSGADRALFVSGLCGVPQTALAIAANVTVVAPGADGDLRLFPSGAALPGTSVVNFRAGQVRANNAVLLVGDGGRVSVRNDAPAPAHVVLDVFGWFE